MSIRPGIATLNSMTDALHVGSLAWDAFDAYLWDIDGTLMHCTDLVHYHAFNKALSSVAGKPVTIDGVVTHGNVDIGILRDAFVQCGVPESIWRPQCAELVAAMGRYVEEARADLRPSLLPGVLEVLGHLKRKGALLAAATGNLAAIGKVKLEVAGLSGFFDFGGWSDGHETRKEVFAAAAEKARARCGRDASLCVVGDTPADIRSAHSCKLPVIAVATGIYSFDQLQAEKPEMLLSSLIELLAG